MGDLNVRLDRSDDVKSRRLTELLDSYGFVVCVNESTHNIGGVLDVVSTRCDPLPPAVSPLPSTTLVWTAKRCQYRALRQRKRQSIWREKVDAKKSSPRHLWRSIDTLLGRGRVPSCDDVSDDEFHRFFDDKVAGVPSATSNAPPPTSKPASSASPFHEFQPVSVDEVMTAVRALPDKSCSLDLLPTGLLKAVIDTCSFHDRTVQPVSFVWQSP